MMDDVNPLEVDIKRLIDTMGELKVDLAAPDLPKWHWKVMERSKEHCKARFTHYSDMLFTVFTQRAWACWQQQIDVDRNPLGWGMDATFHFTCKMRMAIMDEHLAKHLDLSEKDVVAEETRSYDNNQAHAQLAQWLDRKATQYNVSYGISDIEKNYMDYVKKIANFPTQCVQ